MNNFIGEYYGYNFNIVNNDVYIKIDKNTSGFMATYNGPASGIAIAHAANGGDTVHQLFNVLICEINPFLSQGNMKPNLDKITFQTGKNGKNSMLSIFVPFDKSEGVWQLDRRGGWGHDPGSSKMENKCEKLEKNQETCIGPIQNVSTGDFGKITEYFITHTISFFFISLSNKNKNSSSKLLINLFFLFFSTIICAFSRSIYTISYANSLLPKT